MNTKRTIRWSRGAILAAATVAVCLTAPQAWAQKAEAKAAEDRLSFRHSVLAIRGQIDSTLSALDKITKGKDAKQRQSALKKYGKEVDAMSKQVDKTRSYADQMKERGKDYFKAWEKSMKGVTNPELQAAANARRTAVQDQYKKIEDGIAQAKDDGSRFWQGVQDLEKFYANDLSDNALSTSAKLVESTHADGKKVQEHIDDVVKAVDEVGKAAEAPPAAAADSAKPGEPADTATPADGSAADEKPPAGHRG